MGIYIYKDLRYLTRNNIGTNNRTKTDTSELVENTKVIT